MKKLFLISALLLISFNSWAEDSMISLNDYIVKNEFSDDAFVHFYIAARCATNSGFLLPLFEKDYPEIYEKEKLKFDYFFRNSFNIRKIISPNDTDEKIGDYISGRIKDIAEDYLINGRSSFEDTGTKLTDEMINDRHTCSEMYRIKNALSEN